MNKIKQVFKRVPGFRSGTPWKIALASAVYLMILISFVSLVIMPENGNNTFEEQKDPVVVTEDNNKATSVISEGEEEDEGNKAEDTSGHLIDKGKNAPLSSTTAPSGQVIVHFIDVGQGDAILIQTPAKNILIDGGERGSNVVSYLQKQGVSSLDLVIGTHPHSDHIGGLINVLQSISVKEVIDPGVVHTTKTFEDYLTLIDQNNIKFTEGRAGLKRDLGGGASMQILHPSSPSSSQLNNASVVVKIIFGQVSFLFAGDAESVAESQIMGRGYTLTSTVLKVGHHGSKSSTTQAFLNAVKPKAAIIMCGSGNTYGHPHEETLARLANAGVNIYRTDKHGTIVITTDGKTYSVNKQPFSYQQSQRPKPPPVTTVKPASKPEPKPEPTLKSAGKFVGSTKSDKYHNPTCRYVKNILKENEVWFNSVGEAKKAGYVPCGVCKPK